MGPILNDFDMYKRKFDELNDENSKERDQMKQEVWMLYKEKITNEEFCKKRDRYNYLDAKLNLIQDLIKIYHQANKTNSHVNESRQSSTMNNNDL